MPGANAVGSVMPMRGNHERPCSIGWAEVLTLKEHESKKVLCPKCKSQDLEHVIEPFFAKTSSKTGG